MRNFEQPTHAQRVSAGMRRTARKGGVPNLAPVGYRNVRLTADRSAVEVDPQTAPLVRELFRLAAEEGHTVRRLIAAMNAKGLRSRTGRPLRESTLHGILTNPFYYGMVQSRGELYPALHAPLIDRATFEKVQKGLTERRRCVMKRDLLTVHADDGFLDAVHS